MKNQNVFFFFFFYQTLYNEIIDDRPIETVLRENNRKLPNHITETLEGEIILINGITTGIEKYDDNKKKKKRSNKSPGLDGFTV